MLNVMFGSLQSSRDRLYILLYTLFTNSSFSLQHIIQNIKIN